MRKGCVIRRVAGLWTVVCKRTVVLLVDEERFPSGQREQTVNLPAHAFGGSNPPLSIEQDKVKVHS